MASDDTLRAILALHYNEYGVRVVCNEYDWNTLRRYLDQAIEERDYSEACALVACGIYD